LGDGIQSAQRTRLFSGCIVGKLASSRPAGKKRDIASPCPLAYGDGKMGCPAAARLLRNSTPILPRSQPVPMPGKFSKHQQKIIKNYYDNREAISLQRLSELVTELYLAEGKNRQRQWGFILTALEKLKIPKSRIDHLREQDDPALLAKLVEELMAKGA